MISMKKSFGSLVSLVAASFGSLVSLVAASFGSLVSLVAASFGSVSAFAQAPAAAPAAPGTFSMLVPFVAMFAVMYFLMIRPQQKKMKEQQALLNSIQSGDEVVTTSGIFGKVKSVQEKVVTIEIDSNVELRMLKSQIAQKTTAGLTDANKLA
jgi:preprotein translocase subunit YajC